MKEYRLPDGTYTNNFKLFESEWKKLTGPFEKLGFRIIGFDPGILMEDSEYKGGCFNIPTYAARRIIKAIQEKEKNEIKIES